MSLATFKKKSIVKDLGTKRSGKPPGGYWLPQGPFGANTEALKLAKNNYGPVGFSLNGGHRNVGGIGKEYKFSRNGTPFRGVQPYGNGGRTGSKGATYATPLPVYNVNRVIVLGDQYLYVKPSVLSTYGKLRKQYRWAYTGKYPNYWVQPVYPSGTQSDSSSQGVYLHNLTATNTRYLNVNDRDKYVNYIKKSGPTLCGSSSTSTARFKFNNMARNAPYTKELQQPVASSEYTTYIQRRCVNPLPKQKPFPYAVQTGSSMSVRGTSVQNFGTGCGTGPIYLSPPAWYTSSKPNININSTNTNNKNTEC
uniref:Uncharacterized protein n=1 Tax=viral metagenome TaxID=1070528 RepID=A0A6C0LM61_9ZZZZ